MADLYAHAWQKEDLDKKKKKISLLWDKRKKIIIVG